MPEGTVGNVGGAALLNLPERPEARVAKPGCAAPPVPKKPVAAFAPTLRHFLLSALNEK
jgi:hypothetical protein